VLWHLAAVGFFTGFFAVPVNAIMQHRSRKEDKAGILAAGKLDLRKVKELAAQHALAAS
jgi:hypothetical protein